MNKTPSKPIDIPALILMKIEGFIWYRFKRKEKRWQKVERGSLQGKGIRKKVLNIFYFNELTF
ncbi:MAG: hypothetical protein DRR19_31815 [Candidatus Parabeggiatoa sp. nov. 1]|nr:MAG: hypothetical protein DRR19_31815 [Gammaproteobacteria bacterium]